jgi:hypothetical protein
MANGIGVVRRRLESHKRVKEKGNVPRRTLRKIKPTDDD